MSNSLLPPILNPSSLYTQEAKRDATRIRIYNNVLQQIYNKIKAVSRVPGNEKSLWYLVPEFIPGTPRFEVADCVLYLVWNLRNVGYTVDFTPPTLMFISWSNHDAKYREKESPWAQVLGAAREQVLATAVTNSTPSIVIPKIPLQHQQQQQLQGQQQQQQTYIAETKRKTVLRKTGEYRPLSGNTTVIAPSSSTTLTGTLTPKHVSFV
jgi:hypothetical protein